MSLQTLCNNRQAGFAKHSLRARFPMHLLAFLNSNKELAFKNRRCDNTLQPSKKIASELNRVSKNCYLWPNNLYHSPILWLLA
jgi:hypothetical protein